MISLSILDYSLVDEGHRHNRLYWKRRELAVLADQLGINDFGCLSSIMLLYS